MTQQRFDGLLPAALAAAVARDWAAAQADGNGPEPAFSRDYRAWEREFLAGSHGTVRRPQRRTARSLLLAAGILVLALTAALAQRAVTITPLDGAEGELLERAGADLAEVLAQVQRRNPYWQLYYEDIMIYDYGTKKEGEFEVTTTFYTFRQEIPTTRVKLGETAGGTVGGICVDTYAQAGTVCFKVYLKTMFSYNGRQVFFMPGETDLWTDRDAAALTLENTYDNIDGDGSSSHYWTYDLQYGAAAVCKRTALIRCTANGTVTYQEKGAPFGGVLFHVWNGGHWRILDI